MLSALATTLGAFTGPCRAHPTLEDQLSILDQRSLPGACDADAELKRGDLYREGRDWQRAAVAYERAAACAPGLDSIDLARAELYLDRGEAPAALHFAERYLEAHPQAPRAFLVRARARVHLGRPAEAVADFDRALAEMTAPQPDHYLERARAHAAAGQPRQALAGIDEGLSRLGPVPALLQQALELEIEQRRFAAALRRIDDALGRGGNREAWLLRRGRVLEQAGDPRQARQAYESALAAVAARPAARRQTAALREIEHEATSARERLAHIEPQQHRRPAEQ